MAHCITCGENITDEQNKKFEGLCPACVRIRRVAEHTIADGSSINSCLILIAIFGGTAFITGFTAGAIWPAVFVAVGLSSFISVVILEYWMHFQKHPSIYYETLQASTQLNVSEGKELKIENSED